MRVLRMCIFCILLVIVSALACLAQRQSDPAPDPPGRPTIAVADFSGSDREMGTFIAETLLTDLARSERLQPLERAEIVQAQGDLQLRAGSPLTPSQARQLGRQVHADRIVVGSYMVQDGQIVINARLLDSETGLILPGAAMNVTGDRKDLLGVTHQLAQRFHKRITGVDLEIEDSTTRRSPAPRTTRQPDVPDASPVDELDPLKQIGLVPDTAKSDGILTERELTSLIKTISKRVEVQPEGLITLNTTAAPVTRLRALTALVKMLVSPADLATYRTNLPPTMPPDADQIPTWGLPFVGAAIDQGWLAADKALRYRDDANWAFIAAVVSRMPIRESQPPSRTSPPRPADREDEQFTGLLLDARDLSIERSMSPRILDEDGHVVYPEPKHLPTDDYVGDHGMASYYTNPDSAKRAGSHPLVVRALALADGSRDDIVVSNDAADHIREANKRAKFLWRWNVAIVTDAR